MKTVSFFCHLVLLGLLFGACKKKPCPGDCEIVGNQEFIDRAVISFAILDKNGNNYFEANQGYYYGNFMAYDENWNYALTPYYEPWTILRYDIEANEHYIMYSDKNSEEPYYGKDRQKTFYLKFSKGEVDIDTLRLEYKVQNKCMHMEYLRVYFNNELVREFPSKMYAYNVFVLQKKN